MPIGASKPRDRDTISRGFRGRIRRREVRPAVAMLAALATAGGLLLAAGGPAGAHARIAAAPRAGAGLPGPGRLLAAPAALAAAESEIGPVLAQAENPKTALLGTVRLLVNSGVSILNGPKTVYRGRRGGPPMFMQAGAVVALAQAIAGKAVPLSGLLRVYAAANAASWKMGLTASFFGRNFASEITGASGASEYLWAAALTAADTSVKGLVASLNGAGTPADAVVPVQVQLLSLRLQADALATAYAFRPKRAAAADPAGPLTGVPCNIDNIPEWFNGLVSSGYNHGIDATIKHGGFGTAAKKYAERYGAATSLSSIASTVINFALLMNAMRVTTTLQRPLIRTTSTARDGSDAVMSTSFSWPTESYEWLNCARIILNLTGFDGSVPSKIIRHAEVTWKLDGSSSAAARLINDTAYTNKEGIAKTVIEGRRQPHPVGSSWLQYTRVLSLTASINPRSARNAGDLLATDALTAVEAILGLVGHQWLAFADNVLKLAVSVAEELGILRKATPIDMTDWTPLPDAFSASLTFRTKFEGEVEWSSGGPITLEKQKLDFGGYAPGDPPISGNISATLPPGDDCSGTAPVDDQTSRFGLAVLPPGDGPDNLGIDLSSKSFPCQGGGGATVSVFLGPNESTFWQPGDLKSVVLLTDQLTKKVVGSITFTWTYSGK